jgi:hypothetical protein
MKDSGIVSNGNRECKYIQKWTKDQGVMSDTVNGFQKI